jgi:hypothetical protein
MFLTGQSIPRNSNGGETLEGGLDCRAASIKRRHRGQVFSSWRKGHVSVLPNVRVWQSLALKLGVIWDSNHEEKLKILLLDATWGLWECEDQDLGNILKIRARTKVLTILHIESLISIIKPPSRSLSHLHRPAMGWGIIAAQGMKSLGKVREGEMERKQTETRTGRQEHR